MPAPFSERSNDHSYETTYDSLPAKHRPSRTSSIKHAATHFPYWIFPLVSATAWFGMLLALLIIWFAQGHPYYRNIERGGNIAYISDIGSTGIKPLFVADSSITSTFFFFSLLSMRRNQLLTRLREKLFDFLSLLAGLLGCAGLILLSVSDTLRHRSLHRLSLFLFMLGIVLSAIFTTLEYRSLERTFTDHPILRYPYNGKRILLVIEVVLSIAFGICLYKRKQNAGAVLEWAISFIFTAYVISFFFDLRPNARTKEQLERQREISEVIRWEGAVARQIRV